MRKILLPLLFIPTCFVGADPSFDQFKQQYKQQQQDSITQQQAEFNAFRQAHLEEFDHFRQQLLAHWANPMQSTMDVQVKYSDDLTTRILVDEQAKTLTIEQLVGDTNVFEQPIVSERLLNDVGIDAAVIEQLQQAPRTVTQQPLVINSRNVLQHQIQMQHEQVLSSIDRDNRLKPSDITAQKQLENKLYNQRLTRLDTQLTTPAVKRASYQGVLSHSVPLPDNYLLKRASPFINDFLKQANLQQQDLSLLLAISHAESSFDPQAKSHIPAFGLMQIVPSSAGMDVANHILKQSYAPTASELYQPDTNILYGTGYLSILSTRYLKGIKDKDSKKYCVIAAYNTGSGNVARAFNGGNNRNVSQAVSKINAMTSEQVYQTLMNQLPYLETKNYLKKVRKLDAQYQSQLPKWNGTLI